MIQTLKIIQYQEVRKINLVLAHARGKPFRKKHGQAQSCSLTVYRSVVFVQTEQWNLSWLGSFVCAAHLVKALDNYMGWRHLALDRSFPPQCLCTCTGVPPILWSFPTLIVKWLLSIQIYLAFLSHQHKPHEVRGSSLPCAHSVRIPRKYGTQNCWAKNQWTKGDDEVEIWTCTYSEQSLGLVIQIPTYLHPKPTGMVNIDTSSTGSRVTKRKTSGHVCKGVFYRTN